jgi:acetylornithine/succinyldiaminopimelate/putrescine aminotransferase
MNTRETIELEDRWQVPTYRKLPIAVIRGEGAWVWDADGDRYLDFYGGHCVALLGHAHPAITEAIAAQAGELLFYSNFVYSPVRARAASALARLAPEGLRHVFFCNSGTEANETALKLARKATGRPVVAAMVGGFHGRTLGSLSVTWGEGYRGPYERVMGPTEFAPFGNLEALERLLEDRDDVAAVILEPIQSMAGVYEAPPEYFQGVREACDRAGCLLVFDEIQTGVGRTGTFSISESLGVRPDLITMAKSLGNGVPVGAVLVGDAIAEGVHPGDQGTTFGGGMLAMAAVEATLAVLVRDRLMERALDIEARVREKTGPLVREIRGRGALLGLDLGRPARPVLDALFERRVIAGNASDPHVVRIMPPLVTGDETIDEFAAILEAVLASVEVAG